MSKEWIEAILKVSEEAGVNKKVIQDFMVDILGIKMKSLINLIEENLLKKENTYEIVVPINKAETIEIQLELNID